MLNVENNKEITTELTPAKYLKLIVNHPQMGSQHRLLLNRNIEANFTELSNYPCEQLKRSE